MTDQPLDRELLIELITKEVLSTLGFSQVDRCESAEALAQCGGSTEPIGWHSTATPPRCPSTWPPTYRSHRAQARDDRGRDRQTLR